MTVPVSVKHPETVTVHKVGPSTDTDDDGVPITTTTSEDIVGVSVEPLAAGADGTVLDDGTVVDAFRVSTSTVVEWVSENDTCTWRGTTYVVNRRPRVYRRYLPHTEFTIINVRGGAAS